MEAVVVARAQQLAGHLDQYAVRNNISDDEGDHE